MPDGAQPVPGSWNRFVVTTDDLDALGRTTGGVGGRRVPQRGRHGPGRAADPGRGSLGQRGRALRSGVVGAARGQHAPDRAVEAWDVFRALVRARRDRGGLTMLEGPGAAEALRSGRTARRWRRPSTWRCSPVTARRRRRAARSSGSRRTPRGDGYLPMPGQRRRYYDDNAWLGLVLRATPPADGRDAGWLRARSEGVPVRARGSGPRRRRALGGGSACPQHLCSTAPAAQLALRLHLADGDRARRWRSRARARVARPRPCGFRGGLYADHVDRHVGESTRRCGPTTRGADRRPVRCCTSRPATTARSNEALATARAILARFDDERAWRHRARVQRGVVPQPARARRICRARRGPACRRSMPTSTAPGGPVAIARPACSPLAASAPTTAPPRSTPAASCSCSPCVSGRATAAPTSAETRRRPGVGWVYERGARSTASPPSAPCGRSRLLDAEATRRAPGLRRRRRHGATQPLGPHEGVVRVSFPVADAKRHHEAAADVRRHHEREHQRRAGRHARQAHRRVRRPVHPHRDVRAPHDRPQRGLEVHRRARAQDPDVRIGLEVCGCAGADRAAQHRR